jgi:RimJ/RimL family protein N-acetyltransferase
LGDPSSTPLSDPSSRTFSFVGFRPVEEKDLPCLFAWHQLPHVQQWWDLEPSEVFANWDLFVATYHHKMACPWQRLFIVYAQGQPIGYVQYYDVNQDQRFAQPPGTVGIDIFIGQTSFLGKGYGGRILRQLLDELKKDPSITKIVIDPHVQNVRAIRCYEKAGFRLERIIMPEQVYLMSMQLDR